MNVRTNIVNMNLGALTYTHMYLENFVMEDTLARRISNELVMERGDVGILKWEILSYEKPHSLVIEVEWERI
jgi:hypothetical protein